jgi:hypothetical protein
VRTVNIREVAQVVRSKNAGPFRLTLDILFKERAVYEQVKRSDSITAATIAGLYRLPADRVTDFVWFDPGKALKVTMLARSAPARRVTPTSTAPSSTRRCSGLASPWTTTADRPRAARPVMTIGVS